MTRRCFSFEATDYGEYNPLIAGLNSSKDYWDDRFVSMQMKLMDRDTDLPIVPSKLSTLFLESEERNIHIKQLLGKAGIKYDLG